MMKLEASLQLPAGVKIFVGCGFLGLYNPNPNPNPRKIGLFFAKIANKFENPQKLASVGPAHPKLPGCQPAKIFDVLGF